MKTDLILLFTSSDRPGIVQSITKAVVSNGGNWEESRLAKLAGDFAGIARISMPESKLAQFERAIKELASHGLDIRVKPAQESPAPAAGTHCVLRCNGADHEGIVNSIAAYLAGDGINVESMETAVEHAPISGTPLFNMFAEIVLPQTISLDDFSQRITAMSSELGIDIDVTQ